MELIRREEIPLEEGGLAVISQYRLDSGAIRWGVDTGANTMTSRDVGAVSARLLAVAFSIQVTGDVWLPEIKLTPQGYLERFPNGVYSALAHRVLAADAAALATQPAE